MTSAKSWTGKFLTSFILTVLFCLLIVGQGVTGLVTGRVIDEKGRRISGASVTVTNPKISVKKKVESKDDGYFTVNGLRPSRYMVTVEKAGFRTFEKEIVLDAMGRANLSALKLNSNDGTNGQGANEQLRVELNVLLIPDHPAEGSGPRASMPDGDGNAGASVPQSPTQMPQNQPANGGQAAVTPSSPSSGAPAVSDAGRLQLQSLSGERSDLISNTQVLNLALNGRDIIEFMKLTPGIVSEFNGQVSNVGGLDRFSINGTRSNQHELAIDGVSNVDTGTNGSRHVTINPDAVAEMKVLTANYQAEYGKAAGGFIQIVTKSGSTEFHGGARFFHRHEGLNANGFFENTNHRPRSLYRYNSFGYDIGGPVYLPRFGEGGSVLKPINKLFFYVNQEFYRQLIPTGLRFIRVPTEKERNGDFSETRRLSRDPLDLNIPASARACSGQPATVTIFPGNRIPRACFFKDGQAILGLYPLPNLEPVAANNFANYVTQASTEYPRSETIVRVDYQLGERTDLSGRVIHNGDEQALPFGGPNAGQNFNQWNVISARPGINLGFTLTRSFGQSVINETIFGLGRNRNALAPETGRATRAANNVTFPLLFPHANPGDLIPNFLFGELVSATVAGLAPTVGPETTYSGLPFQSFNRTINVADNLTRNWNTHLVKIGIFFQDSRWRQTTPGLNSGRVVFSSTQSNFQTGHAFANAMLGLYEQYNQIERLLEGDYRYRNVEAYAQDLWRVNERLALDLGLRVAWYQPQYDARLQASFFDPALFDPAKAAQLFVPVLVNGARRAVDPALLRQPGFVPTTQNTQPINFIGALLPGAENLAALGNGFGFAGRAYPRSGVESRGVQWGPRFGFAYDLLGDGRTILRGGFGVFYDRIQGGIIADMLRNPASGGVIHTLFNGSLDSLNPANSLVSPPPAFGIARDGKIPTVYSFNLNFQRDLGWGTVADVAYVGTLSRHLTQVRNLNAVPYGAAFELQNQDPTKLPCLAAATPCTTQPNLFPTYTNAGLQFSGANAKDLNFLRPYRGLGEIRYYEFGGSSNYHSLQLSARRRLSRDLTLSAAYTWSKAFSTAGSDAELTNAFDPRGYDYRLAAFDRTHVFIASYVYTLPGLSRRLGGHWLAKTVFDGWQASGITQFSSGQPYEVLNLSTGVNQLITGSLTEVTRVYLRAGVDPRTGPGGLLINPEALLPPRPGQSAPAARNYLRGPGVNNWDLSIFKNIPLGKEGRSLQLRFEMFNAFNHTQFSSVNFTAIGQGYSEPDPNIALTTRQGIYVIRVSGQNELRPLNDAQKQLPQGRLFGEYNNARSPRIIQLAAKFYF